jgi:hypothetical protein
MQDLLPVFDPATQLQAISLVQFAGLTLAPTIERVVQYLKENWAVSSKLAPLAAIILGMLANWPLALLPEVSLGDSLVKGLFTGLLASGWYVMSK